MMKQNQQNSEKSPKDLRRFSISQFSAKDHQLTLVWKIHSSINNNNNNNTLGKGMNPNILPPAMSK